MSLSRRDFALSLVVAAAGACGERARPTASPASAVSVPSAKQVAAAPVRVFDPLAVRYVKLVLALGRHDEGYVDAYYGPPALRTEVDAEAPSLAQIDAAAKALVSEIALAAAPGAADAETALRQRYLARQTAAVGARARILLGEKLRFDDESEALYDARAPVHEPAEFERVHRELAALVPGRGPLGPRLEQYRKGFVIGPDKLRPVFDAAIAEARRRTLRFIPLPAQEAVTLEFVTDKPWGGYNWYLGEAKSLVQINTDLPIFALRALDVAAHESYPGHHVYNALLEQHLVRARGFVEMSIYALYSPQSLVAEGSANYGIEVAFPDRAAFLRDALFPIAGLPPAAAEQYVRVEQLSEGLKYVGNEAARGLIDGTLTRDQARDYMMRYALSERARAEKFVTRAEKYRTYLINYNYGRDLIADYVAHALGGDASEERRWAVFRDLLASPRLPTDLRSPS